MKIFPALLALALVPAAFAQTNLPQQGRWLTESGNLEVDIAPCGDTFCGTVSKVLANRSMSSSGTSTASLPHGHEGLSNLRPAAMVNSKRILHRENANLRTC